MLDGKLYLHDVFAEITSEQDLRKYLCRMSKQKEYAEDRELAIAAMLEGVELWVYRKEEDKVVAELTKPLGLVGGQKRAVSRCSVSCFDGALF
jgi:hypothetical protein